MNKTSKIFVAGHKGLVGSAIVRELQRQGYENLVLRSHAELDLSRQNEVASFFEKEKPEFIFLAAAKVGGIAANNAYRADFIYENLQIQNNVIHQSYLNGAQKLLFLGSTCIYPKEAPQPIKEEYLLTSELEYTNEPYAVAKIAGLKMCEAYNLQYGTNFLSVMPTNLYGINDNFDLENSHVLPALLRKFHLAKLLSEGREDELLKDLSLSKMSEARAYLSAFGVSAESVEVWGSGRARREFLFADDMAKACVFIMQKVNFKDFCAHEAREIKNTHINIGSGKDIAIADLALLIKDIVGFEGELCFNTQKPDGTLLKRSDISRLESLGFRARTSLEAGIKMMYEWYLSHGGGVLDNLEFFILKINLKHLISNNISFTASSYQKDFKGVCYA